MSSLNEKTTKRNACEALSELRASTNQTRREASGVRRLDQYAWTQPQTPNHNHELSCAGKCPVFASNPSHSEGRRNLEAAVQSAPPTRGLSTEATHIMLVKVSDSCVLEAA